MKNNHAGGITIIEIMISLALSLIVIGIASTLFMTFLNNYSLSFGQSQSLTSTQQAITQIAREIRELRTAANGAWPISAAGDNDFIFYSDITNDGLSDQVRYYLDGTTLKKSVIEPSGSPPAYLPENSRVTTISENVLLESKPLFTYYDGNWPADQVNNPLLPASRISSTRYVDIYIRIAADSNNPENAFETVTGVQLRNLKDNL